MDPLDLAVYRFLAPGGVARFWAGRRVIDPRITSREIAAHVGASESGVRRRLQRLADRGYLQDRTVLPNPSLFGQQVFVVDLLVREPREVDQILRDLSLIDGVVFTRDILDESQRKVRVHFVTEDEAGAQRRAKLIGRLAASTGPVQPRAYYIPACESNLSPIEWRVLLFLRHNADATLADLGDAARISLRSAARCYHHLIDSHAAWWTHGPESEEFPLALVQADLASEAHREPVAEWIRTTEANWIPVARDGLGLSPGRAHSETAGLVPADAPAALERFVRRLANLDGVDSVRRTFALGSSIYPRWFTDRIAARVVAGR